MALAVVALARFEKAEAPLALAVDLVAPEALERLPERRSETILGLLVPAMSLAPFEASAPAKLHLALQAIAGFGRARFGDR